MLDRLHKVLAAAGVASRRNCEELIQQGRVRVDGAVVSELGSKVDPATADIRVDGERVRLPRLRYFAVHKPRGMVSAASGPRGEPLVTDLLPRDVGRVFPVGRLDKDSEGLVLLTNDGALTERLTHPRHEVPKVYEVTVRGAVSPEQVAALCQGVWLSEGKAAVEAAHALRPARPDEGRLAITLREGKNRQIRRMLAKLDLKVRRLLRTAIGPLELGRLPPGAARELTAAEVAALAEVRPAGRRSRSGARSPKRGRSKAPPESL